MSSKNAKKKNGDVKKKSGGGKLAIGALLLLLLGGGGVGIGLGGHGAGLFGPNNGAENTDSSSGEQDAAKDGENNAADSSKAEVEDGEDEAQDSGVVTVVIRENQVFVGEKEFANAEVFKAYIEEINNDARAFRIKEENAIQATYEWVTGVFDELKIQVLPSETEGASVDGIQ